MSCNILILSAGRRVELINCFKNAAKKLNVDSKIVAADLSEFAPAIYFADCYYLIPRIGKDGYLESIIDICNKENISLVIPTIDTELLFLAESKNQIEEQSNAKVMVSDLKAISICRNKIATQKFFEENAFGVPKMYTKEDVERDEVEYPIFIKPLDGSSSINAFKVNNAKEAEFFVNYINKPMIQECIVGEEYTVDVFCDFDSNPITIVPRRRIATRSGEIAKGQISRDHAIIEDVKRLISVLKPIGHITVQCMKTEKGIQYIEINPRFGGGAPMAVMSGADSCENLYRLLRGEKLEYYENYQDKQIFLRFDSCIQLNEDFTKVETNDKNCFI